MQAILLPPQRETRATLRTTLTMALHAARAGTLPALDALDAAVQYAETLTPDAADLLLVDVNEAERAHWAPLATLVESIESGHYEEA